MKKQTYACKDCGEVTLHEKEPGLFECLTCGRMTAKQPIKLPVKLRATFGRKCAKK